MFLPWMPNLTSKAEGCHWHSPPNRLTNHSDLREITMNVKTRALARSRLAFSVAVLFACGCSILTASAADADVRKETVSFKDLSLETPAGIQALYKRIHAAAQRVCSESDPLYRSAGRACAREAESRAVETVGNPQLTAYFRAKTGQQPTLLAAAKR